MGPWGLEPQTFAMSTQRSNQLSYEPVFYLYWLIRTPYANDEQCKRTTRNPPAFWRGWAMSLNTIIFACLKIVMGKEGVEPSRHCCQQILSLSCMPFHHLPSISVFFSVQKLTPSINLSNIKMRGGISLSENFGGQGGSRTLTTLRPTDFKSVVYAIPPLAR